MEYVPFDTYGFEKSSLLQTVQPIPTTPPIPMTPTTECGNNIRHTETTLITHFLDQASIRGVAPAIAYQDTILSYAEVDRYSLGFARLLLRKGLQREQIVLCRFAKSPWAIVAFLGILRAGLAFTPVDPSHPTARTRQLAEQTNAALILESETDQPAVGATESWHIGPHLFLDIADDTDSVELPIVGRGDLAYVYFTSGSSGRPKGVMVHHGAIYSSLVAHGDRLGMSPDSRVLQATSYTFDPCLTEIFGALIHGACICIPEDLTHLGGTINKLSVNWAFFTPSTISLLHPDEVPTLQIVSVGGEPLTQDCIDTWAARVQLYNSYGPTEACVFCCIGLVNPTTPRSIIGHPVGCQAWIVDPTDHNKLVAQGEVGELLIEGEILARGYLNDAEKTAAAYVTGVSWAPETDPLTPRRFYKTGDLARLEPDGTIACLGRRDKQIKIRGQRVELGDIESNIKQQAGEQVLNVFVELVKRKGVDSLAAFLVFRPSHLMSSEDERWKTWRDVLLDRISKALPAYMVPSVLIPLREVPTNSSGKADRAKLRERYQELYPDNSLERSRDKPTDDSDIPSNLQSYGAFETEVAHVLSLALSALDMGRTFTEQGGNSLLAIKLVSRLRKVNLQLTTKDMLRSVPLSALGREAKITEPEISPEPSRQREMGPVTTPDKLTELRAWAADQCDVAEDSIESIQHCTPFQESLLPSLATQPCTYVGQYTCRIPSGTDMAWFRTCWETAYERFPILRSRFVISPTHGAVRLVVSDRISWRDQEPERARRKMANEEMGMGTSLSVFAIGSDGETYDFILTLHHLLYDEWSLQLCFEYVAQLYGRVSVPMPGPSFDQFVRFSLEAAENESSRAFWHSQLSSASVAQFPRLPHQSYKPKLQASHAVRVQYPVSRTAVSIRAALALAMGIHTGLNDICFGTVMSGRDADLIGIDDVVGPTLATVPVRLTFEPTETVASFLDRVEHQQEDMRPHEHYGLQNIRKVSESASVASEFQTMLVIQAPSPVGIAESLFGEREEVEIRDSHALVLECSMTPQGLLMEARFDTAVISPTECERFLGLWEHLLAQISRVDGDSTLASIDRLTEADRRTMLRWNGHVPQPSPGLVQDYLAVWTGEHPGKVALDSWDGKITYRELDLITTRLASMIVACNPSGVVPLHFPKSLALVISVFAVLKAGRAFVCLDTEAPADRLTQILEQLDRPLVLTHNSKSTHALASVNCWTVDKAYLAHLALAPTGDWALPSVKADQTAYMIMTSGSTGRPKGVLVGHEAIMTTIDQSGPAWGIKSSSRMLQFVSVAFDAAIMEMFSAVVFGACLCIPKQGVDLDVLSHFVKDKRVNWAFFTPSFLRLVKPTELPGLETVVSGGEAMTAEVAGIWASKVHLVNAYGPCECAITCASTPVQLDSLNTSSIGKAIGCALWIVDAQDHNRLAPVGTVGELVIEGAIVGRGYLNDEAKTAAAFLSQPAWTERFSDRGFARMYKTGDLVRYDDEGNVLYVGRKDNQVKLRGQRLELGEVEHNVQDGASRPALCFVPTKGPLAKRLVAVLGARSNNLVPVSEYHPMPLKLSEELRRDIQETRKHVASKVPSYMVPEKYAVLRDLPISLAGKLDRKAVAAWIERLTSRDEGFFSDGTESLQAEEGDVIEATPAEDMLRAVWAAVLGMAPEKVGLNRSFQSLGGDSITAMQAIARSRNKGLDVSMKEILRGDTIRFIASRSDQSENLPPPSRRHEDDDKPRPVSAIQKVYALLAPKGEKHYFNQSAQVQVQRRITLHDLEAAVEAVVARHASLRSRYDLSDSRNPTQRVVKEARGSYTVALSVVTGRDGRLEKLNEIQAIPNPTNGPIIHCELVEEEGEDQRLYLVAPHLAVDIVSWRIILEDLETALEGLKLGPRPPMSYQDWCEITNDNQAANPDQPEPQYSYWGVKAASLIYRHVVRETFSLSASATSLFLGRSNDCLRTRPTDLLVSAIAWAFCKAFPDRQVPTICLEGHGRHPTDSDVDVSSTVGWFTTVLPVSVQEALGEDLVRLCARTKDARFQSERRGADFFRAQAFSTGKEPKIPEIMVNFTGIQRTDVQPAGGLFREDGDSGGDQYDFSDNMRRFAVFDIAVSVRDDVLCFELSYDDRMPQRDQISHWLSECETCLDEISVLLAASTPRPTLSDFPVLPLTYDDLSRLEKTLGRVGVGMVRNGPGVGTEAVFAATPMQSQMLRAQRNSAKVWRVSALIKISSRRGGTIDIPRLVAAWEKVVAANPALRTILVPLDDDGRADANFINVVLDGLSLSDYITTTTSADPRRWPSTEWSPGRPQHHLTLLVPEVEEGEGASRVMCRLEINHALVDHASMSLLQRSFSQAYEEGRTSGDLLPYESYATALTQDAAALAQDLDFWHSYLGGARPTRVSDKEAVQIQSSQIFPTDIHLSDSCISERLLVAAKAYSVTPATVFRLAWALTLRAVTGEVDVVFGVVASGRDMTMPAIDRVVGPVMNIVACRVRNAKDDMLAMLGDLQEDFFSSSPHQRHLPTYMWGAPGADSTKSPALFDTVLNYRTHRGSVDGGTSEQALLFAECLGSEDPYEYAVVLEIDSHETETTASLTSWSDKVSPELASRLATEFRQAVLNILSAVCVE
ncbi:hypothetical protein F5Y17DRAFT_470941 [Xylariaceae sp. FL0594]|nr:hypothetical protein F5Y17DRAFT_470941 [Xylariaceae sp. FL0594]